MAARVNPDLQIPDPEDDLPESCRVDDDLADPWFAEPNALIEAIDDDESPPPARYQMSVVVTAAALVLAVLWVTVR
jgi:hypothetical protein